MERLELKPGQHISVWCRWQGRHIHFYAQVKVSALQELEFASYVHIEDSWCHVDTKGVLSWSLLQDLQLISEEQYECLKTLYQ